MFIMTYNNEFYLNRQAINCKKYPNSSYRVHILAYACSKGARFSVKLSSIEKLAFISDLQIVGILCSMYIYLSSFVSVLVSYCHSLNVLHCAFSENIHALKTYSIN